MPIVACSPVAEALAPAPAVVVPVGAGVAGRAAFASNVLGDAAGRTGSGVVGVVGVPLPG